MNTELVDSLVRQAKNSLKRKPVLDNDSQLHKVFLRMANDIFEASSERINKTIGNNDKEKACGYGVASDGGYKCIHLGVGEFVKIMNRLVEKMGWKEKDMKGKSFLDVGCGVGQKVFLAHMLGFQSYGLELRKPLLDEAVALNHRFCYDSWERSQPISKSFVNANALTYKEYGKFDILYFYCPLFDDKLQIALEKRLLRQARSGTIIVGVLSKYINNLLYDSWANPKELKGWKNLNGGRGDYGPLMIQKL